MMNEIFEIGQEVGNYRVIRVLGSGGMGVVYEVEHTKLKIRRALKVFAVDSENIDLHRARFLSEGKILSALDHPRIVRVHEFEVDEKTHLPYFVMDIVLSASGMPRTLEDERREGITEERVKELVEELSEGLRYVHAQGVVHRDVKLENVLIASDGHAVLADFGISRIFDDKLRKRLDVALTLPQERDILRNLGSVCYQAPEMEDRDALLSSPASDMWALGVVVFRLLTGVWLAQENRDSCMRLLLDYDYDWREVVEQLCNQDPTARRIPETVRRKRQASVLRRIVTGLFGGIVAAGIAFISVSVWRMGANERLLRAEDEFLVRELYEPVELALAMEPETNRVAWAGVLQTARDMLYAMHGTPFRAYRDFIGRGAQSAYDNGCTYPLPIAVTYASSLKSAEQKKVCYDRLLNALQNDKRWNAATRFAFLGFLALPDRASIAVSEATALQRKELKRFLNEKPFNSLEIGAAFDFIYVMAKCDLTGIVKEIQKEGGFVDPWLANMIDGTALVCKDLGARDKALEFFDKAYQLRPDLSQSAKMALRCSYGKRPLMELWERRIQHLRPDNISALAEYLFGLRPRWGGTPAEMSAYCLKLACNGRFDTMVPIFAYEYLVSEVFIAERELETEDGVFPNVDRFVEYAKSVFHPYFDGYRRSDLWERASLIERAHICACLTDLAWRLAQADELLYWTDRLGEIGMPLEETYFQSAYLQYKDYLPSIRKLEGEERRMFVEGVHAYTSAGNYEAIGRIVDLAAQVGDTKLVDGCRLFGSKKVNLVKLLKPCGNQRLRDFQTDLGKKGLDRFIIRVRLTKGDYKWDSFKIIIKQRDRDFSTQTVMISAVEGVAVENDDNPDWTTGAQSCDFELEVCDREMQLVQNGKILWRKKLLNYPSLSHSFSVSLKTTFPDTAMNLEFERKN